jgi:hypothetical protein
MRSTLLVAFAAALAPAAAFMPAGAAIRPAGAARAAPRVSAPRRCLPLARRLPQNSRAGALLHSVWGGQEVTSVATDARGGASSAMHVLQSLIICHATYMLMPTSWWAQSVTCMQLISIAPSHACTHQAPSAFTCVEEKDAGKGK